jgi:hypothetical protein
MSDPFVGSPLFRSPLSRPSRAGARRWTSALAAVGLAWVVVPAAPAVAAATPRILSLSVPTQTFDCETSPGALVTAHLTDPAGIVGGDPDPAADGINVSYISVEGYAMLGTLVSGTAQDGEWSFGPFCQFRPTPTWTITTVHLLGADGGTADVSPASAGFASTLRTVGRFGAFTSTVPASNIDTTVTIGSPKTVSGRLSWYYNGAHAVPGAVVRVWEKVPQTPTFPDGDETLLGTATTAADGTWSFTWRPTHNSFRTYVTWGSGTTPQGIRYADGVGWTQRTNVRVAVRLGAVPISMVAGTVGLVTGNVLPNKAGRTVHLQRLTRTGWTTVSTALIRSSGRFTLLAQPPTRGLLSYRVYKPGDAQNVGATTRSFSIRSR